MTANEAQALYGALSARYGVGFSQDIADQVERLNERDTGFLDIKELNDLAAEYRVRIRTLVHGCRLLRSRVRDGLIRQLYASHEDIFVRRQITDLWALYRICMADSHEMTACYLARLQKKFKASHPIGKEYRAAA
jgi:hypothetical protein